MPTSYRRDTRTWMYVAYAQADAPTREIFREKALRNGYAELGADDVWTCAVCASSWKLRQLGVSFGSPAAGSPVCPTDDCSAIGWDYFSKAS